ncbi:DUF1156 domain-containing protein [Actinoplanes sp. RD1]|uniref:DUF1156 domain-containing protein n=1 Tax=Actinoplanes sp. RD1 TaxID=3064538 RepID=UPI0027420A57|nr:DUF1156 domain-containing protein [Actinoplanes sp. RD1]
MSDNEMPIKRKLIEVALPLEAINRESAREKSIRHGHPSTLHLWWARRPLAACRAVLFAQLVDDPSAHPDKFPTDEDRALERRRLFDMIEKLVTWENINDDRLLSAANREISRCYDGNPPTILDPFAGGGSIPLEAQRLGLQSHASDLNPVPVLINKALIEIPPKWIGHPPVFPGASKQANSWPRSTGLAEDVRKYGIWMREEANRRIGHLYPQAKLPDGTLADVIAWIWTRTVTCPNPACGIQMPLVRSWWLGKKRGKEAYVIPKVGGERVEFSIGRDPEHAPDKTNDGTVNRNGATCIGCRTSVPLSHIRSEGKSRRIGKQLMAIVAEGSRHRIYLPPTAEHEQAADITAPEDTPDTELPEAALGFRVQGYGMTKHADLFTPRQLVALNLFCNLVKEARDRVFADALGAGLSEGSRLQDGGMGAAAYADSVAVYLAMTISKIVDIGNALVSWKPSMDQAIHLFTRQAIPMLWDFSETPILSTKHAGGFAVSLNNVAKAIPAGQQAGIVNQADASSRDYSNLVISTDPPYYDNVAYADLSDVFYVWLRRSIGDVFPKFLGTMLTPKTQELVADPFRRGGEQAAERYFEDGFINVFEQVRKGSSAATPITVFYAFKQTENDTSGTASTGWEVLLEGMIRSGWEITATWPIRTELGNRMRSLESNALASSVVLACRPRPDNAATVNRRTFLSMLKSELPQALKDLQQSSIAPVDLAQAAIGPGMAIFSRYKKIVEPDGSSMPVRAALTEINRALDEVLAEQEGDFDADTRFCVKWFSQYGWDDAASGTADTLSRAVNTSVDGLVRGGIFWQRAGKAHLVEPNNLSDTWDPATDDRISIWEVVLRLAKALNENGVDETVQLMAATGERIDLDAAKELAYLLFSICEKRRWTQTALLFNGLGTSWSDLSAAARVGGTLTPSPSQGEFDFASIEE